MAMTTLHAEHALLPDGWAKDVRLTLQDGEITAVETATPPSAGDERHAYLLPGTGNLHSHAFQRAMAGLAELRGPGDDSFWSWRETMYRFALSMTPEHVQAVAAQLYMEMLEAGFTRVGEFHYLHHDKDGAPYAEIGEMAARIAEASRATGLGLTLLPVFYARSGFGGTAPNEGQRRFINEPDRFARLHEACRGILGDLPGSVLGIAPHSLRAATPEDLAEVLPLAQGGPIHIHVAEQVKEVEDCLAWSGARPVEWLLENAPLDARWCLIHATHMTADETRGAATRGAIAGLCPITEANLGDGIFDAPGYLGAGGRFGVGSDSNIRISLTEELRSLEYSQRLGLRARNVVARPGGSTGRHLFEGALNGGAAALGCAAGIGVGAPGDLVSLDTRAAPHVPREQLLDHWVFADGITVDCVWARSEKRVAQGRHLHRDEISAAFRAAMLDLAQSQH
ncbi:formimidoylglutamate deiminase [Salipiger sp. PrR002]|uniref:formimidoylglutamate deiminase n=1 Tax=Salipiger sp. PrR002 TaxID=2706489 RepID=UPI0034CEE06A